MHFSNLLFPNGNSQDYFIFLIVYQERYRYFVLPKHYAPMNWEMTGYEDIDTTPASKENRYGIKFLNEQTIDLLLSHIQNQEISPAELRENLEIFRELCEVQWEFMYALPLVVMNFDKKLFSAYIDYDTNSSLVFYDNYALPEGWNMVDNLVKFLNDNTPIEYHYWLDNDINQIAYSYINEPK